MLCSDSYLAKACEHVRGKEIFCRLLKAGHEKLLKMYAEGLGIDVYSVSDLSEISAEEIMSLLKFKSIQEKILEIDGPAGFDENEDFDEDLLEATNLIQEEKAQLAKIKNEEDQLLAVVKEARSRHMAAQAETERIATALRVQGIDIEVEDEKQELDSPSRDFSAAPDDALIRQDSAALAEVKEGILEPDSSVAHSNRAKLNEAIVIKRAQLQRLQEQLKISKTREATGALPSEFRSEEDEAAALACRQARLQRRMERKQQASDPSKLASKSGLAAMGIDGPTKTRYSKGKAEASAGNHKGKIPAWL